MVVNRVTIVVSFILGIVSILLVWFWQPSYESELMREDGIVESLTAVFYLVGFVSSFVSIFNNERKLLPVVWAVLCLLFLGEETSWFQRQLNYSVQAVEQVSAQSEFNLHNLNILEGGSLTESSLGLSSLFKSQNLYRLGFFGYFLFLPLLLFIPKIKKIMYLIGYKQPANSFVYGLLLVFVLSFLLAYFSPLSVKNVLAETREMLYAFYIMIYVIVFIWPSKNRSQLLGTNNTNRIDRKI